MFPGTADPPSTADLLLDWLTIWHSELAALATDREQGEAVQRMLDAGAAQASVLLHAAGAAIDAARPPRPDAPPGSPPAGADADGKDARIEQLLDRVEHLERRLAELERR